LATRKIEFRKIEFRKIEFSKKELSSTNKTEVSTINYSKMPNSWRVMISSSLWNQKKYEEDFATRPEVRRIAQSKGRCKMVSCPKVGDMVSFVMKGKIVMRGIVESNGFENGTDHREHSCNVSEMRPHSNPNEFSWVRIIEVGLSENIRHTGQRTWAKMPV